MRRDFVRPKLKGGAPAPVNKAAALKKLLANKKKTSQKKPHMLLTAMKGMRQCLMKNYIGPSLGGSYAGKNLRNKSSAKYYGSLLKGFSVGGKVTKRKKNKSANISKKLRKTI